MSKVDYFPLVPELKRFSLRVALRVLFGNELWNRLESNLQIDSLVQDIHCWSKGLLAPPTSSLPWTTAGKAMKARSRIHQFILSIIQEQATAGTSTAKPSLLNSLINSRTQTGQGQTYLSHEAIIDNILTLLFAGSDTTASILTSAFFVLAKDKALLHRLQTSVDDKQTLEAFLTETQRLYPAAPFTMRVVHAEGGIHISGYHIPKGWYITYALAAVLLDDSTAYPDPHRFSLDRWLRPTTDIDSNKTSMESWTCPPIWSFGGGHRMCPGRFLANAESIILLQQVLRSQWVWTLDSKQNLTFTYQPGLFPVDGLRIQLRKDL
jgi:cytochrome P450 monooxygenase